MTKDKKGKKIFQSESPKRWKRMLWAFRLSLILIATACGIILVDLFIMPYLYYEEGNLKQFLKPDNYNVFETRYNREFYELRQRLAQKHGTQCLACTRGLPQEIKPEAANHPFNKQMLLVFDDGPHAQYTPKILKILKKKKVPASFFIIGVEAEENLDLIAEMYESGFEIGNHTFTHPHLPQTDITRTLLELRTTKRLIECVTGVSTLLFRPPYSEQPKLKKLPAEDNGPPYYYNITESIDPRDYEKDINADTIVNRVARMEGKGNVILLHDGGGDRTATIEALPRIIDHFEGKGYEFVSVAEFLGLKRKDVMPPLQGDMDAFFGSVNRLMFFGYFGIERLFITLFLFAMIVAIIRYLFIALLAWRQNISSKKEQLADEVQGKVSIIVPAYNEEVTAVKTIANLLKMDYPDFEIIFVDDGSKDDTYKAVKTKFDRIPNVKLLTKENGGKATALNYGIEHAEGNIMVCIDADTQLKHNAIRELMKYFTHENVAAVAGNVKVGNERNTLTYWQSIEYITSQNFDRRAFDVLNCITVIPGAIGAFKKHAMVEAGLFDDDTLAEDCDLTMRLLKLGYTIRYSPNAIAVTEAPEDFNQFIKQRHRWMFGIMQSFWKHREMAFNPKYKSVGFVSYPNMIIFQLVLPFLAPIADVVFLLGIVLGNGSILVLYFMLYLMVEALGAALAFSFEKEDMKRLIWLIPQRLVYRQVLFYILVKSILRALKGEVMKWGFLKRTGNVETLNA